MTGRDVARRSNRMLLESLLDDVVQSVRFPALSLRKKLGLVFPVTSSNPSLATNCAAKAGAAAAGASAATAATVRQILMFRVADSSLD